MMWSAGPGGTNHDSSAAQRKRSQSVRAIIGEYFPGIADKDLHSTIEHALTLVHTEHRQFHGGPLRQVLVITYVDPSARHGDTTLNNGRAVLRLQLRNGLLHELRLHGRIARALDCLEQIAAWLERQAYDPDAAERHAEHLTHLVNTGPASEGICRIHVARYASVAPPPAISENMVLKMALAALNLLRTEYGLERIQEAPQVLIDYVASTRSSAKNAIQEYLSGLDQTVLAVISDFHSRHHYRYDDLKVYNFLLSENGEYCRNRVQAVRELPWLLRILSGMDRIHSYDTGEIPPSRRTDPRAVIDIIHAIDAGRPLFDGVALALGVPKETVRWTRHRILPNVGQFAVTRMELLLAMLSWLPPEKRPETDSDWRRMRDAIFTLLPVFTAYWDEADLANVLTRDPRYGTIMARWLRELARPALCSVSAWIDRMRRTGDDPESVKDYVKAVLRSLHRYCKDAQPDRKSQSDPFLATLLDWLASQSIHSLMGMSRRWHATMQVYLGQHEELPRRKKDFGVTRWAAVLLHPVHVKSIALVEITDSGSLMEEGRMMNHCVGARSWECVMGDAMIVSIRDIDGRRLSTAQLTIHDEPVRVTLREHKGKGNKPPPERCDVAAAELVALLNGTQFRTRLVHRREFQKRRCRRHEARQELLSNDVEQYLQTEEYHAWACTFGPPPVEKSVELCSVLQARRSLAREQQTSLPDPM